MTTIVRHAARAAVLLAVVSAVGAEPAHAQIGGLKKKVSKAVTGVTGEAPVADTQTPAATPRRSPYGEHVLEIDVAVLDRLEKALAAETASRQEVASFLAKVPSREVRAQCEQRAATLPEMQKALDVYVADLEKGNGDDAAIIRAAERLNATMTAVTTRECGEDVSFERMQELQKEPGLTGARAGNFTDPQYAILKERVVPFCSAGDKLVREDDAAAVPVDRRNRLVYSRTEIDALTPRCAALTAAIAANS